MPRATANLNPEDKIELKSCPEGYIVLRRMTYGQKLDRMKHVGKLSVEMGGRGRSARGEMEMLQKASTLYDFKSCIVDHNLEDESGTKLNLGAEHDINRLDPRIGEEISVLIDKLNNFETEETELGNSETASDQR